MNIYFQGLLLGLAYVAPIGVQNLYIIQNSLQGNRIQAFFTAIFIIINDIALACACYFGVGKLLLEFPQLKLPIGIIGIVIILYVAYSLWNSDAKGISKKESSLRLPSIFATSFAVTWFNPQALIDGTMLFGSIRASLPASTENIFIAGFASASMLWFSVLTIAVRLTKKAFNKKTQLLLNKICAIILILFCVRLLLKLN